MTNEEFQNKIQNIQNYLTDFTFFVNYLTFVTFDKNLTLLSEGIGLQNLEEIPPEARIAAAHGHARP